MVCLGSDDDTGITHCDRPANESAKHVEEQAIVRIQLHHVGFLPTSDAGFLPIYRRVAYIGQRSVHLGLPDTTGGILSLWERDLLQQMLFEGV
jgi:hypothetical protein